MDAQGGSCGRCAGEARRTVHRGRCAAPGIAGQSVPLAGCGPTLGRPRQWSAVARESTRLQPRAGRRAPPCVRSTKGDSSVAP